MIATSTIAKLLHDSYFVILYGKSIVTYTIIV